MVQKVVIDCCQACKNVHLIGEPANAFQVSEDETVVSCIVAEVDPHTKDLLCWDTYKKGYCPRSASCRWMHPRSSDLVWLFFTIGPSDGAM
jgi:hypothetical protein